MSSSADRTLKFWSLPTLEPMGMVENQSDVAAAVVFTPEQNAVLVGRMDGSIDTVTLPEPPARSEKSSIAAMVNPGLGELMTLNEVEPNNKPEEATPISLPVTVKGVIQADTGNDVDLYRFSAKADETWVLDIKAARNKSPLDSRLEVLDAEGQGVERVRLQAVRETWLTFRGKNSSTSDDFRVFNWEEMTLNQYLYINGEVVKLWHYPRGPDSGFIVYPGRGNREGFFDTTPLAHPLGQTAYIVEPLASGVEPLPNGLPVFTLYHENDDASHRRFGRDSSLTFTAPKDGDFLLRVSDIRGSQGKAFAYELVGRAPQPDFKVSLGGLAGAVPKGAGREFNVKVERVDGFNGPVDIELADLPEGFRVTSPVVVEAGQTMAFGAIYAAADAGEPETPEARVTASATVNGETRTIDVKPLGGIKPEAPRKLTVRVEPEELTVAPGQTVTARVVIERNGFPGRVEFGKHDSGRNLPHGVYVDNIGLNGLMIPVGQTEQTFFITADPW
ncbi:MAG: hypothetical protein AAF492_20800, partial [Verrucomicrobiota bacterium]